MSCQRIVINSEMHFKVIIVSLYMCFIQKSIFCYVNLLQLTYPIKYCDA
jgi:hypothetical protein